MARKTKVLSNRFTELLAVKARREGRRISRRMVSEETGLSRSAIDSYARNEVTRFDSPIIIALCDYFDCELCDLLVIEETEKDPEKETPLLSA